MKLVSFSLCLVVLVLLGWSPALAQGQVWIVDDDGGAGVDFTEVQPAIDVAASGDTILLRAGTYGNFLVDGKGVRIVEDVGGDASVQEVTVANIAAAQSVSLRGFRAKHI